MHVFLYKMMVLTGRLLQQTIGIPMRTKWALLLSDLFLYAYET